MNHSGNKVSQSRKKHINVYKIEPQTKRSMEELCV